MVLMIKLHLEMSLCLQRKDPVLYTSAQLHKLVSLITFRHLMFYYWFKKLSYIE